MVVFPDWGNPIIPSFMLDLISESLLYLRALDKPMPKWRNRQTRTTQNRVPNGNEGSIPSFGTATKVPETVLYTNVLSKREDVRVISVDIDVFKL